MSKLYDNYLELKKKDNNSLYLFKSGMFYIFLDQDANLASKKLNLKLTMLNNSIVKCGFPINSLAKYTSILDENEIKYDIIDGCIVSSKTKYIESERLQSYLDKLKKIDINKLSPIKAFEILSDLKELLRKFVI